MPPQDANKENRRDDKKDGDKKEEKKDDGPGLDSTAIVGLFIVGALLYSLFLRLGGTEGSWRDSLNYNNWVPSWILYGLRQFAVSYVTLATVLSLFFVIGIVYGLIRVRQAELEWRKTLYPDAEIEGHSKPKNEKWVRVTQHINSDNPSDWRLAILEADIILDELLDWIGYIGDTIGDKLKKANKGDFATLDYAWEAHRIRNAIAHEGQDFVLTQREARRIISLFEAVFTEFDFIDKRKDEEDFSEPTRGEAM